MNLRRRSAIACLVLLGAATVASACRRVYAVVPRPNGGYRAIDTLRATQNGDLVRVTFRFDTVTHTRTVYRTDTLYRDTLVRRDTVKLVRRDTVKLVRHDTIRLGRTDTVRLAPRDTVRLVKVDTVRLGVAPAKGARVDTVRIPVEVPRVVLRVDTVRRTDTVFAGQPQRMPTRTVDTLRVTVHDTILVNRTVLRVDTLRRVDTVRVAVQGPARVDTVTVVQQGPARVDTVRIAGPGRRMLFVPPGQYPPEGQCRVWIYDRPPGQQDKAESCDAIGDIPAGAFILFGGEAWDFDYDWLSEDPSRVPAPIVALKRRGGKKP